ncbi:hypothetical protein IW261DRAFT_1562615 [Armillaria novae-zelandiae]|uniref:Uncharacterized protein n=1 Tax=Armillaria novae-zelandiae TaxID=153914 RepID=A0AA39PBT2_9AGAR|nr:hypothetical protein IW261DRAFT_1562615 [Armillaria novae-zelandiae]
MEAEAAATISIEQYLGGSPPPIAPVCLMPSNPHLKSDTFCFGPMDQVPMGWGETEVHELSNCPQTLATGGGPHSLGVQCHLDNACTLRKHSGVPVKWMRARRVPAPQAGSPQVHSAVRRMLRIAYHSPPELLEANMESESEEMAEPATGPEASGASPPTGDASSSDEEGEGGIEQDAQASVAEEELVGEATDAGVEERSPTPPGLDTGSLGLDSLLAGWKCIAPVLRLHTFQTCNFAI